MSAPTAAAGSSAHREPSPADHEAASGMRDAQRDGGFALYVHWPFCAAKCPYCDFNSHVRSRGVDQARYAAALARELATMTAWCGEREPTSVFFGGGTPSLMEPATVATVLAAVRDTVGLPASAEVSLEANPSSVEARRFEGFAAAGVNRVSLGVQSLRDEALAKLGRLHDVAAAKRALAIARETFARVSADMIYARPGQSVTEWSDELAELIAIAPGHLSLYELTIEPGTRYFDLEQAGKLVLPDEDRAAELYEATHALTQAAGYTRYEVSNHARAGEEARHNLTYWRGGRYIGIGPGAHGRLAIDGARVATATELVPERWLERVDAVGHGVLVSEPLGREAIADETLLMGLRLAEGIALSTYQRRAGVALDEGAVAELVGDGLLEHNGGRIRITEGARVLTGAIVRALSRATSLETA